MNFHIVQELKLAPCNGPIRVGPPFSSPHLKTETDPASDIVGCLSLG